MNGMESVEWRPRGPPFIPSGMEWRPRGDGEAAPPRGVGKAAGRWRGRRATARPQGDGEAAPPRGDGEVAGGATAAGVVIEM